MATLAEELAADLAAGIAVHGQTFEWQGTAYPCVRNSAPSGLTFEDGGEVGEISEMILVARAAFSGALPQKGDGIDADTAQIKRLDPARAHLVIYLGSFDE